MPSAWAEPAGQPVWVIGPNQNVWLADTLAAVPLPSGCTLGDIAIDRNVVRVQVPCSSGPTQTVLLQHPSASSQGLRTKQFHVIASSPELGLATAKVLEQRESSWAWQQPPPEPVPEARQPAQPAQAHPRHLRLPAWVMQSVVPSTLLCFLLALLGTLARSLQWLRPWLRDRPSQWGLAVSVATASWLRLAVAPHLPLNQVDWTRIPFHGQGLLDAEWLQIDVVSSQVVQWLAIQILPGPDLAAVAILHALTGVASVVFLGALVGRLTGSRLAMIAAAMVLALLPIHVRHTASTNLVALLLVFSIAAVSTAVAAAQEDDPWLLGTAAAWTVLAELSHGMARLLILVVAWAMLAWTPAERRWRPRTWLPLLVVTLCAVPGLVVVALDAPPPTTDGRSNDLAHLFDGFLVWWHEPRWFGLVVWLLAGAGLVTAWRSGKRADVMLWTVWLASVSVAFGAGGQTENNAALGNSRYLIGLWPPLLGAASHGVPALLAWPQGKRWLIVALVLLVADVGWRQGPSLYTQIWNEQRQTLLIDQLGKDLQSRPRVWLPPPAAPCCPQQQMAIARQLHQVEPHLNLEIAAVNGKDWQPAKLQGGDLVFVGMPCWSQLDTTPKLSPVCTALWNDWQVRPVQTQTFANTPFYVPEFDSYFRLLAKPDGPTGTVTLGLYRLQAKN